MSRLAHVSATLTLQQRFAELHGSELIGAIVNPDDVLELQRELRTQDSIFGFARGRMLRLEWRGIPLTPSDSAPPGSPLAASRRTTPPPE